MTHQLSWRWALAFGLSGVFCCFSSRSVLAEEATPERPAEKLSVELPSLTVIGQAERPDAAAGTKLMPETLGSSVGLTLPSDRSASNNLLERLQLSVPDPPDRTNGLPQPSDRLPYTALWAGAGGFPIGGTRYGRYDFGLDHGRTIGPATSLSELSWQSHGIDQWSSLRARQELSWGPSGWAMASYRREQQEPVPATAVQEGAQFETQLSSDLLSFHFGGQAGRVQVWPITSGPIGGLDEAWLYDLAARASYALPLDWTNHSADIGLTLGQQGATQTGHLGWSAPHLAVTATDVWAPAPWWSLDYGLGLSTLHAISYFNPQIRATFKPGATVAPTGQLSDAPTDLWAQARTDTTLPGFEELYQGRLRTAGNADLLPQRTEPALEVGVGHRFSDRWYGNASTSYSRVLDWIYYGLTPNALWQPRNYATWQDVWDLEATAQYLWNSRAMQHVDYRLQDVAGLGQVVQEMGTRFESNWLDGSLSLSLGTSLQFVQLGVLQAPGSKAGVDWLASWQLGYRLTPVWQLQFIGNDWHVIGPQEPALGYFATPALVTAGLKATF